jgi:hypothetical protein
MANRTKGRMGRRVGPKQEKCRIRNKKNKKPLLKRKNKDMKRFCSFYFPDAIFPKDALLKTSNKIME